MGADRTGMFGRPPASGESLASGRRAVELESLGRHAEAAAAFEAAGMPHAALRNWREAGEYEKALPHASGRTKVDLQWLIRAEKLMRRRPEGIQDRLEPAERKRLGKALRMPRPQKTLFG